MATGDEMVMRGIKTRAAIKRIIIGAGHVGISQEGIRKQVHVARGTIALHCRALEAEGHIEKSALTGHMCRWGAPGIRAASVNTARKKTDPQRWRNFKDASDWADAWTEQPPVRVLVSANDVPPLGKPGIASVWELAA